jgi:hypothetical protein
VAKTPSDPFEVNYTQAAPGDKQLPAQWSIPFDVEFRAAELPNAPEGAYAGYASIGWHVARNSLRYCPAYKVLDTLNLRVNNTPTAMAAWTEKTKGHLTVTDRRNGMAYWLAASVSSMEAVVAWFVRESGHDNLVLCHDRLDGVYYLEAQRTELQVFIGADGTEVAQGEGGTKHYLVDKHPNAIMIAGE